MCFNWIKGICLTTWFYLYILYLGFKCSQKVKYIQPLRLILWRVSGVPNKWSGFRYLGIFLKSLWVSIFTRYLGQKVWTNHSIYDWFERSVLVQRILSCAPLGLGLGLGLELRPILLVTIYHPGFGRISRIWLVAPTWKEVEYVW